MTRFLFKKNGNYNAIVILYDSYVILILYYGHVIPTLYYGYVILTLYYNYVISTLYHNHIILMSSFAFNQTSNIVYPKILYALFLASNLFSHCYTPHYCHPHFFYINSNITYFCINSNTTYSYTNLDIIF